MTIQIERIRASLAPTYTIDRELGRGGWATVFLAQDAKHERMVALKVLHPEHAASLGPDRFLQEIRIVARLSHPHILPLFDSGEIDGLLYYVMPYVEGESLRERLNRQQHLPVEEAVHYARAEEGEAALERSPRLVEERLELNPDDAHAINLGASIAAGTGDRARTIGYIGRSLALSPEDAPTWYNAACAYSLLGMSEEALAHLETAVGMGWRHKEWLEHDSDFANVRDTERFRRVMESL